MHALSLLLPLQSREKLKKGSAKGVIQLKVHTLHTTDCLDNKACAIHQFPRVVSVQNAKLVTDKEDEYSFTITSDGKKYTFQGMYVHT